ncbi:MAG: hypothetical protein QUS14_11865, partial [Pyrinomonadaceae bacterium]|nr:hypothetical protein [Pyrinomonadaceae bacterium]
KRQPTTVNTNTNISNTAVSNTNANFSNTNSMSSAMVNEAREPEQYQATVTVRVEALGDTKTTTFPTLAADVARAGDSRRMVFTMPAGGRVVFLDKSGQNYLVLPDKNQYAELNRESLGFEVRRLLMPDQIVDQVRGVQGMQRLGEEPYQGPAAIKYRYAAVTDTQTPAGDVATESFLWVDKETGLPLRSETVSRSQTGGNVQGYQGLKIVTEITNVNTTVPADAFADPTTLQKIESEQVRAQVDMIFNTIAGLLVRAMGTTQQQPAPAVSPSPTMSPR